MNDAHELTASRLRAMLEAGEIDGFEFAKMHHRGTYPEAHLEYMEKVDCHEPGGTNAKVADWINEKWLSLRAAPLVGGNALHTQEGGDHYKGRNIQPVEYIEANDLRFLEGCIIKRATRHGEKSGAGVEDLKKIMHEAQLIALLRYGEEI